MAKVPEYRQCDLCYRRIDGVDRDYSWVETLKGKPKFNHLNLIHKTYNSSTHEFDLCNECGYDLFYNIVAQRKKALICLEEKRDARVYFCASGLSYADIGMVEIYLLKDILSQEVRKENELGEVDVCGVRKQDVRMCKVTGGVHSACLRCYIPESSTLRKIITFTEGGHIDFAGFNCQTIMRPVLVAFKKWCDEVATAKLIGGNPEPPKDEA